MLYILKMDNPQDPNDLGEPTRVRLIGPFESEEQRIQWEKVIYNNPHNNPCWQCVTLEPQTILGPLLYAIGVEKP